jgi:hypothetical protein
MDFDFFFKLVLTCCFFGVTICLCIKWIVESYLDYVQVMTGIRVMTLEQQKEQQRLEERTIEGDDDDPFAH